ncbi:hypothetical protein AB2S62_19840 [Vibrio sp. NTOU-M3]|uniref:hypothetical protein n=1 Tax=Vibrio sp. NTOU-M3 TaxID=3234954 RepID=UPI00349F8514
MGNYIITLLSLLLIISCSYNNVYSISNRESGEQIQGIKGRYDSGASTVNIVFIHGMGFHPLEEELADNGSTTNYQNRIAKELGFTPTDEEYGRVKFNSQNPYKKIDLHLSNGKILGGHVIWRKFKSSDGRRLNLFALSWDEITVKIQKSLLELDGEFYEKSQGENREENRAYLNRELKRFINRSFSDPAIYLGSFGDEIRFLVATGVKAINSAINENEGSTLEENNQIIHISDSLGSSIVFDTVVKSFDPFSENKELSVFKNELATFAGRSSLIFMNANQLPLIELGNIKPPLENDTEDEWLSRYPCNNLNFSSIHGFTNKGRDYKELNSNFYKMSMSYQLVAFSDPNDALSYHLTNRFISKCGGDDLKIFNVSLTNAKWNYFFILAHPGKAHSSGFKVNDTAIDILINGVN